MLFRICRIERRKISQNVLWIYGFTATIAHHHEKKKYPARERNETKHRHTLQVDCSIRLIWALKGFELGSDRKYADRNCVCYWLWLHIYHSKNFKQRHIDSNAIDAGELYRHGNAESDGTGNFDVNLTCSFAIRPKDKAPFRHGRYTPSHSIPFHFDSSLDETKIRKIKTQIKLFVLVSLQMFAIRVRC